MIPKALLLAFLSWQQFERIQEGIGNTPAVIVEQTSSAIPYGLSSNDHIGHSVQSGSPLEDLEVIIQAERRVEFDSFPVGVWNASTVVNRSFKLESYTGSSIYDVAQSFPKLRAGIRPSKVWGTYPNGPSLSIKFVDGIHKAHGFTFAWVVDGELTSADWITQSYKNGKAVYTNVGKTYGSWVTLGLEHFEHDETRFAFPTGHPSGIMVVLQLWADDPITAVSECQDIRTSL